MVSPKTWSSMIRLDWLASEPYRITLSSPLPCWSYWYMPPWLTFSLCPGDPNLGLHALVTCLLAELHPQSYILKYAFYISLGYLKVFPGRRPFISDISGKHDFLDLVIARDPRRGIWANINHVYSIHLSWLDLLNPLTSWELEEKPSSLRLVLSLAVGLSVEATGPISLWAPLWVSFCFLASFLWDMCKGKITVRWF